MRALTARIAAVLFSILAVSLLHYGTQTTMPVLHDVYRRLYYIPVGLAAMWFGVRGGLAAAVLVGIAYVPHILLDWHHEGRELANQFMEIAVYLLFSGLVGFFADQERRFRERWREAAEQLDRSYRKLREQADMILQIEGELRRADRLAALGQLAAGMAHEVRNPLGGIKGTAEILRDDFPPGHPKREFLDILLKESDRLNRVVESLLDYVRDQDSSKGTEIADLRSVAAETAALLDAPARKAGVSIRIEGDAPVPVRGSASQLKQLTLNLLLNAMQATPGGNGVVVRAEVRQGKLRLPGRGEVPGEVGVLVVEDEGVGIPADALPRVFEAFFTTKAEGTGLGLAISRRIAQAHGGDLQAENREAGGARFTLTVPLCPPAQEKAIG